MKTPISEIKPGRIVSYHGHSCIVLEHRDDGTFIIPVKPTIHEFGTKNNFALSQLTEHLNNSFLHYITDNHPDEIIRRNVDLTAINGSRQYSSIDCQIAPLTLDELRKSNAAKTCENQSQACGCMIVININKSCSCNRYRGCRRSSAKTCKQTKQHTSKTKRQSKKGNNKICSDLTQHSALVSKRI